MAPALDDAIPDTPAQENALLRYWILMLLALTFTAVSMRLAFGKNNKPPGSDAAP